MQFSKSQKKRAKRCLLGLLNVIGLAAVTRLTGGAATIEQFTIDSRYKNFNRSSRPSDDVVIIDIDEQSIKNLAPTYGRWPWPRRIYKDMIEFLEAGEPSAILFDVLFTEAQIGSDDDRQFAEATVAGRNVSHALQFMTESSRDGVAHAEIPPDVRGRFSLTWLATAPGTESAFPYRLNDFALPFPAMLKDLAHLHVVNTDTDRDGVYRHIPIAVPYDDHWYPALSLQALMMRVKDPALSRDPNSIVIRGDGGIEWRIPLDKNGLFRLHFYRDMTWPKHYRVAEVIESAAAQQRGQDPSKWSVNPLDLAGKTILIGGSATGLEDLKATPVSKAFPGVLLHATAISNILQNDFLKFPPEWMSWFALLILSTLAYGSIFFLESIAAQTLVPLAAFALYLGLACWLFQNRSLAVDLTIPLGGGLLAFIDSFIYMSFIEGRERRRMTGTLSKYLSPEVTAMLAEEGVDPTAEIGKKKELSVMFTDVRGFTTLSESLAPEMVVRILNEYLAKMTDIVFHHDGTLDKFIGDAVMAFWGAPLENPAHARRALEAAFAMRRELTLLNKNWHAKSFPQLAMGVGINTGEVIVGNIGSEKRLDYTVIGDNVNLASRLESLTKYYGVDIILGPRTYAQIAGDCICRPLDLVQVKGKNEAVEIYEPLCFRNENGRESDAWKSLANRFTGAWNAYRLGRFEDALRLFRQCHEERMGKDGPSQLYMERCNDLLREPPAEWTGVYIAKSK